MCIETIKSNAENILKGEIGALLHDIGKMHPSFIRKQSVENINGPHHAKDIKRFIKLELIELFKQAEIELNGGKSSIYDLIKYHHSKEKILDDRILNYLEKCDKKDSADDKGIVRRKQHLDSTWISSPFGHPKEKIDLACLQKRFDDLQDTLIDFFKNYQHMDITCFRSSLLDILKTSFSHALGETRIPANDVTLWDHSYSTASLFKTVLAGMACGAYSTNEELKWRIFGICWNGVQFINKGKKVAEIQSKNDVIENLKTKLKKVFEEEIPIGNIVYEDTNGIYFTFPNLDKACDLAEECAKIALETIYRESHIELWPFFTLSRATQTLTIIANELKLASEKRKIPRITPTLFVDSEEKKIFTNPKIDTPDTCRTQDVCPICGIRPKSVDEERCSICDKRRKGRLLKWLSNREETIWVDEVADKNNRIALISLSFYLDKWLDGTMLGTVYSQTFESWLNKNKEELYEKQKKLLDEMKNRIAKLKKEIEGMNRAKDQERVRKKIVKDREQIEHLSQKAKKFASLLYPNKETALRVLDMFFEVKETKKEIAAKILNTFFEEDINLNKNTLEEHLNNIKERIGTDQLTKENLATFLFTQNPSPARLYRIWRETEEFLNLVVGKIKSTIYSTKWTRVKFTVNTNEFSKLAKQIESETPYIIQMENLNPSDLLVFHNENGEFYTIESLEKYRFEDKTGLEAIKSALEQGMRHIELEEDSMNSKNLIKSGECLQVNIPTDKEEYYPFIEINRSPLSLRLIVPAQDSIKIINLITNLYNEMFKRVIGKLPLNIKLLVTKRKFPLYVLLDAENRMLEGEEFTKQLAMNPWWNPVEYDEFYSSYPTNHIEHEKKYTLDDLSPISKGKTFYLYPGYFDFDLLLGNIDRYNIVYSKEKKIKRADEYYKLLTGRPYYFYQISEILELWDVLTNLSSSQIHFIEEALTSKLREWRDVKDENKKDVFMKFAEVTLKDAFGNKWNSLRDEAKWFILNSVHRGLLLDTINLFSHVLIFSTS